MQFEIDSNFSSFLELLYTVKDCIQKDMNTKQWKQVSLLDLWKKLDEFMLETCNVQCNRALIRYYSNVLLLLILYYFNNMSLHVSPTYKSQRRRFSLINGNVQCNMILRFLNFVFLISLYNAEYCQMWKIYSVPCDSAMNKFYCICICTQARWIFVALWSTWGLFTILGSK
jgi:hypothetical protein